MADKDNKVVNTEEQNRAVNPSNSVFEESDSSQKASQQDSAEKNQEQIVDNDGRSAETPNRIEGDDAEGIDSKIPNL